MKITSISRILDQYLGRVRETIYKNKVDTDNKQIVEKVVYYRQVDPSKGTNVDIKV